MDGTSPPMPYPPSWFLTTLLRDVSRTFYKTLRVLPAAIRPQISLAYLLARATDTVADTELVAVSERLAALRALRGRILGSNRQPLDFRALAQPASRADGHGSGQPPEASVQNRQDRTAQAERMLLERIEEVLLLLGNYSREDQLLIREVLSVITRGQELDLERFGRVEPGQIVALQDDGELDDYTYRVAGCVGEFWTRICRAHLFPKALLDEELLLANGIRFGKGLQLVNILRDLPADLRRGRCYPGLASLQAHGLLPEDLLQPATEPLFRPLYNNYLAVAEGHLAAGWHYTNSLPRGCWRVRLACAWPILIGNRTLALLKRENMLDPARRIKVSRSEVKRMALRSVFALAWRPAWEHLFEWAAQSRRQPG